jgi:hypothetical protein
MESLNLPILPTGDDETYLVLLPGLDRSNLKNWDYEYDDSEDLLTITCIYGGLTSEGEVDGVTYPVEMGEEIVSEIGDFENLRPINPLEVDLEQYVGPDEADKMRLFFKQLENKYGRSMEGDD